MLQKSTFSPFPGVVILKCIVKRQNATNRFTHFLCGIRKSQMPKEDLDDATWTVKLATSWFRVVQYVDFDIVRTFSIPSYQGFASREHFLLLNKMFDDVYETHRRGLPACMQRPLMILQLDNPSTETEPETHHGRKIKRVQVFDPAVQRVTDMENANVARKKRSVDATKTFSKKRKTYFAEDEEEETGLYLEEECVVKAPLPHPPNVRVNIYMIRFTTNSFTLQEKLLVQELTRTIKEEMSKNTPKFDQALLLRNIRETVAEQWRLNDSRELFHDMEEKFSEKFSEFQTKMIRLMNAEMASYELKHREFRERIVQLFNDWGESLWKNIASLIESQPQKFTWEQMDSFAERERKNLQLIVEYAQSVAGFQRPQHSFTLPSIGATGFPGHQAYSSTSQQPSFSNFQGINLSQEDLLRRVRENSALTNQSLRLTPPRPIPAGQMLASEAPEMQRTIMLEAEHLKVQPQQQDTVQPRSEGRPDPSYQDLLDFYQRSSSGRR